VLYSADGREPEEVVITGVSGGFVYVRGPGRPDYLADLPVLTSDLTPLPDGVDPVAASQASLNEFAAAVITASTWRPPWPMSASWRCGPDPGPPR
jgi:hypothetical protein